MTKRDMFYEKGEGKKENFIIGFVIPEIFNSFLSQFKYVIFKNFKFNIYKGSLSSDV